VEVLDAWKLTCFPSCAMLSKAKTTVILFALFALAANAANLRRARLLAQVYSFAPAARSAAAHSFLAVLVVIGLSEGPPPAGVL
jgi:hypothetical protein